MAPSLKPVATPDAPAAIGPYSQAIVAGDVKAQTERVFANLTAVLTAAGSGLDRVVKATVFLADMADFAAMNEVYGRAFGQHRPARSTVAVRTLPKNAKVEIDLVALAGGA